MKKVLMRNKRWPSTEAMVDPCDVIAWCFAGWQKVEIEEIRVESDSRKKDK